MTTGRVSATAGPWGDRVDTVDWNEVRDELDRYSCALTGPLLTADETAEIASLYPDIARFRSTIDMRRHRFGEGVYRAQRSGRSGEAPATSALVFGRESGEPGQAGRSANRHVGRTAFSSAVNHLILGVSDE